VGVAEDARKILASQAVTISSVRGARVSACRGRRREKSVTLTRRWENAMHFPKRILLISMLATLAGHTAGARLHAHEPKESFYMVVFSAQVASNDPRLTAR
jgi:hypothetical protein